MVFRDHTYSVLLASASEKFFSATSALLSPSVYWPIRTVRSAGEVRRALPESKVDLLLINAPLTDELGSALAMDICSQTSTGVLLFVRSELYEELNDELTESGVMVLPKPTSAQMVTQSLRMLCASHERLLRMEEKQASVEEKIQEIRLVNRAKWLLIEHRGLSEEEAHRQIEKTAMDRRVSRAAVAQELLRLYEK